METSLITELTTSTGRDSWLHLPRTFSLKACLFIYLLPIRPRLFPEYRAVTDDFVCNIFFVSAFSTWQITSLLD